MTTFPRRLAAIAATLLAMAATSVGAVEAIESGPFQPGGFRGWDEVVATCGGAQPSFLCHYDDDDLTRVPTKGTDFFFTPAGELAGAFVKMTRGQQQNDYNVTAGNNLVPHDSVSPGGALLVDGEYLLPEGASGEWTRVDDTTLRGEFTYSAGGFEVSRTVILSSVSETAEHTLVVEGETEEEALLQFATPGIGRVANPVVKIGYGDTFALNPGERAFEDPTYVALQKNNRNNEQALILLPRQGGAELAGAFLRPNLGALQTTMQPGEGAVTITANLYAGPNELVRYTQEGYLELPGLFDPNILGRLSLLVVRLLQFIHEYVPSWGLSIIVLTLLFRAVIWPLITTQTKSMFGMQALQPKLQELQKKHKDDREKLTQETMKLYREAGVNPAGGCLPILLQMPLFLILWRVFVNFEFAEGFLWIPDLGRSDPTFILPILYVAVMVAMSYFSSRSNPAMMRQSMIINVVFGFIIFGFPAGVLLYYVVSMLVQVFQYWLLYRGRAVPAGATPALATGKRGK